MLTNRERDALRTAIIETFSTEVQNREQSRTLEEERRTRTIKPTVIIGLGGAGCGIGARLKRAVQQYYRNMPHVLDMIEFVMFDTEPHATHRDELVSSVFAAESEYIFLGGFSPRSWVHNAIGDDVDLRRWWPETIGLADEPINAGCRRFRPLGRLCLYRNLSTVRTAISRGINQAIQMNAQAIQQLNLPPLRENATLSVHVISGSCGGTGSGMLLDVLTLVRRELATNVQGGAEYSAVIVMPTFYRRLADTTSEHLLRARGANGYAFLRELQYFYHHPDEWADHCIDAASYGTQGGDRTQDTAPPAQTCYLLDDEVSGRTVPNLDAIYGLAADALFQKLIAPVAADTVDNNAHLLAPDRDRVRAFSSMGVSYLLYPRKTIARCAGAAVLRDLIDERLRPRMTPEHAQNAEAEADQIFKDNSSLINVRDVTTGLSGAAQQMRQQIPDSNRILKEARTPGATKPKLATAMKRARDKVTTIQAQGRKAVQREADSLAKRVPAELIPALEKRCMDMLSSQSIEYAVTVLRHVIRLVDDVVLPTPVGPDRGSTIQGNVSQAVDYVTQVEDLETDWKPDFLQRGSFERIVKAFAQDLTSQFSGEITETAAGLAGTYRTNILVPALQELVNRLQRLSEQFTVIRNQLDSLANDQNVEVDESVLPITTQYVPAGGVAAAVDRIAKRMREENTNVGTALFTALAQNGLLWRLSDENAATNADALVKAAAAAVQWVCNDRVLDQAIRQNLADVIENEVGTDHFVNEVLPHAVNLADPTWRVDPGKIGGDLRPDTNILPNWPVGFPRELLGTGYFGGKEGDPGSQEPHKMVILKTEHGLPLHCLAGIEALRNDYRMHLTRDTKHQEPPHISALWTANPDLLEDVFPAERAVLNRSFALGLFTDWLVRTKKHEAAVGAIRNWQNGVIYEPEPNHYRVVALKKRGADLIVDSERQLASGRINACDAFTQMDAEQVATFMAKFINATSVEEVRNLVKEYCETELEPRTDPRATFSEDLKRQLRKELEELQSYAFEA